MTAIQGDIQPIRLKPSVQQALGKHLLSCYPHEACGVLLGAAAAGGMLIDTYVPISNVAPDPLHAFVPHPSEWIKALYNVPSPIGLFHSHPHSTPLPSAADLSGLTALGAEFQIYVIGSPGQGDNNVPYFGGYYIDRQLVIDGRSSPRLIQAPIYALLK
ncbi:M67 family metallopeptidase [Paenibacillus sp. 19GGS1-52]|uniref:Mov34/MPN/PAD-1 family protein n=1 Tax=Paenibacillus sp. 19GGS1-52 TaxID=2758563 RepID=UPI001EFC17C8|nr:M67 family metallopeptidase [Paenibacillus sp. 19GGS1-52]ULO05696.1 M67 family metallopeptidase [Paenibacillus sp. 19GGS1-52]